MKIYNTLLASRKLEDVAPLDGRTVRIYTCGPTVYDHAHIGNLSSFIFADTLRRAVALSGHHVQHVMNYTDVDDKTIRRSRMEFPDDTPEEALKLLTDRYIGLFNNDLERIGNELTPLTLSLIHI